MSLSASLIPPKVLSQHKHLMALATKDEFLRLVDIFLLRGCATVEEAVTESLYRLRVSPTRMAIWVDWRRHEYECIRAATSRALHRAGILEHEVVTLIHMYVHHAGWISERPPRCKWELRY